MRQDGCIVGTWRQRLSWERNRAPLWTGGASGELSTQRKAPLMSGHRVLIYEMILGEPPFDYPSNKKEITEKDRKKLMNRITACKINKPSQSPFSLNHSQGFPDQDSAATKRGA